MPFLLIALMSLHVLVVVFWAGSTFTLARSGGVGADALLRPQLGTAAFALLTGAGLWILLHGGAPGRSEQVLSAGAVAALLAIAVQAGLRNSPALSQRIAAALLILTIVCMVASRYAA